MTTIRKLEGPINRISMEFWMFLDNLISQAMTARFGSGWVARARAELEKRK